MEPDFLMVEVQYILPCSVDEVFALACLLLLMVETYEYDYQTNQLESQ
jgi:hypothetical protein